MSEIAFTALLGSRILILCIALAVDAIFGEPDVVWRRIPHPVVVMGRLIDRLDRTLNRPDTAARVNRLRGIIALTILLGLTALAGLGLILLAGSGILGFALSVIVVAILLAARSLHDHVRAVAVPLGEGKLAAARHAVSMIVGRDTANLDEAGVARAAIESCAENYADGVVAPAFWYLVAGLPGILVYKALNTADSMIGHRTERHVNFGWAAARLDDVANFIPARLAGMTLVAAAMVQPTRSAAQSFGIMLRDAGNHTSPNAGWPEAAMAGALDVALAGPRSYREYTSDDAWLNADGRRTLTAGDIDDALRLMHRATIIALVVCVLGGLLVALS
ncbi:MAG: adenosylcobinamide-phosphate synthase CbiB [Pseudomonadota bacterium]